MGGGSRLWVDRRHRLWTADMGYGWSTWAMDGACGLWMGHCVMDGACRLCVGGGSRLWIGNIGCGWGI